MQPHYCERYSELPTRKRGITTECTREVSNTSYTKELPVSNGSPFHRDSNLYYIAVGTAETITLIFWSPAMSLDVGGSVTF